MFFGKIVFGVFLTAIIPRFTDKFSEQSIVQSITINDGVIKFNGLPDNRAGDLITVVGSELSYELHGLSKEFVNYSHLLLEGNTARIPQRFIDNVELLQGVYHTNIKISIAVNEALAFKTFEANPDNYIFIIPMGKTAYKNTIPYNLNADYLTIQDSFCIVIYLWDKDDKDQHENISLINEVETAIMKSMIQFKVDREQIHDESTVRFDSSSLEFGTDNSIVSKMMFNYVETLYADGEDWGYIMDFENMSVDEKKDFVRFNG